MCKFLQQSHRYPECLDSFIGRVLDTFDENLPAEIAFLLPQKVSARLHDYQAAGLFSCTISSWLVCISVW